MTKKRAMMFGVAATACLLLASGSAARAQDRQDVLVQPPMLPEPERGLVAGALARLALGPGELERGTFALPDSVTTYSFCGRGAAAHRSGGRGGRAAVRANMSRCARLSHCNVDSSIGDSEVW